VSAKKKPAWARHRKVEATHIEVQGTLCTGPSLGRQVTIDLDVYIPVKIETLRLARDAADQIRVAARRGCQPSALACAMLELESELCAAEVATRREMNP
jgi:hypothetical protein